MSSKCAGSVCGIPPIPFRSQWPLLEATTPRNTNNNNNNNNQQAAMQTHLCISEKASAAEEEQRGQRVGWPQARRVIEAAEGRKSRCVKCEMNNEEARRAEVPRRRLVGWSAQYSSAPFAAAAPPYCLGFLR